MCVWSAHLNDRVHVGEEVTGTHVQQHHQSSAHILTDLSISIPSNSKQTLWQQSGREGVRERDRGPPVCVCGYLNEGHNIRHESSWHVDDELVHTGYGMGPGGGGGGGGGREEGREGGRSFSNMSGGAGGMGGGRGALPLSPPHLMVELWWLKN